MSFQVLTLSSFFFFFFFLVSVKLQFQGAVHVDPSTLRHWTMINRGAFKLLFGHDT